MTEAEYAFALANAARAEMAASREMWHGAYGIVIREWKPSPMQERIIATIADEWMTIGQIVDVIGAPRKGVDTALRALKERGAIHVRQEMRPQGKRNGGVYERMMPVYRAVEE